MMCVVSCFHMTAHDASLKHRVTVAIKFSTEIVLMVRFSH
jgi:hypothetical protein